MSLIRGWTEKIGLSRKFVIMRVFATMLFDVLLDRALDAMHALRHTLHSFERYKAVNNVRPSSPLASFSGFHPFSMLNTIKF
jgi:hypothetical protein